ncbi:MAG: ribonuclease Z [Candidatus Thermoplasmatota archaeon]|nr:ribonuclease Z [Candidatus Thermoplasmatota archaeon]
MRLIFLGTGGTYPSMKRGVTSIAVQLRSEVLLLDCGECTQRQLMGSSVSFMKISRILISHLHADHFLGLPGLIQSMSLNGREDKLVVLGPEGTADMVESIMNLGHFDCGYEVVSQELAPGDYIDAGTYGITAANADHTVPSLAYSIEERTRLGRFSLDKALALGIQPGPLYSRLQCGETVEHKGIMVHPEHVIGEPRRGRKVVYTGDTRKCSSVTDLARAADVLIHDATFDSSLEEQAVKYGHSTARQAAEVAVEAGVGRLFLVHISPRYDDSSRLTAEAVEVFAKSMVPDELSEYVIDLPD